MTTTADVPPVEHAHFLVEHIPAAELVELPGAGMSGDRRWRELLNVHDELAAGWSRSSRASWSRRPVTGSWPPSTAPAAGSAARLPSDELRGIGLQIRVGLHTGEVELRDGDVGGVAVHIAARVMVAARPGEVVTSRTVRDLVFGSDIAVEDRGEHALKGIDGSWQHFAVSRP
jgi:hypothetical protein